MGIAISLHVLAAIVWVGGMFFAYMALRPVAATLLEPPQRLTLWSQSFARFFPWVWASVITLLGTGYWMFLGVGIKGLHVHIMMGLGLLMVLLFIYVFFAPYGGLKKAVAAQDWPTGGKHLARIRQVVGTNLILGLITSAVAAGGRYL